MVTTEENKNVTESTSLSSTEEKFRTLLNTVNGYEEYVLTMDGIIISSNLEAANVTGYEEWEIIGKHLSIFYSEQDQQEGLPAAHLQKVVLSGKHTARGFRVKKKGTQFFCKMKFHLFTNEEGTFSGIKMVLFDTTHKALYVANSRKITQEYLSLYNNSCVGMFKIRLKDFAFLSINNKALEIINKERSLLRFQDLFLQEDDFGVFTNNLYKHRSISNFLFRLNDHTEERYCSVDCKLFINGGFAEGILTDATEMVSRQNEIRMLNTQLETFLFHTTHDLRQPIPTILAMIRDIRTENHSANVNSYCTAIEQWLGGIEKKLQLLGKTTLENSQPVKYESVDIETVLDTISTEFLQSLPYVKLLTDIKRSAPLYADRQRITTILKNIIANAFYYSLSGREYPLVQIRAHVTQKAFIVQIEDNGCGIEKKFQKDIFKMFFKIRNEDKGAGLGLYVAQSMLRKLGGRIDVTSVPESGTCISLSIPNKQPVKS